ncbi:hypothetical protein CR513_26919, partial [Mucuna pruriens]
MDRSMIDVASGGALMDKTPATADLQYKKIRGAGQPRMVNEIGVVDNLRLENQLTELTSLVRQLAVGQYQPSIAASNCAPPFQQQQQQRVPAEGNSLSLEDLMKQFTTNNLEFQQNMNSNNMYL